MKRWRGKMMSLRDVRLEQMSCEPEDSFVSSKDDVDERNKALVAMGYPPVCRETANDFSPGESMKDRRARFKALRNRISSLCDSGKTAYDVAELCGCSKNLVNVVWRERHASGRRNEPQKLRA